MGRRAKGSAAAAPDPIVALLSGPPVLPPGSARGGDATEVRASVSILLADASSASMVSAEPCLTPAECDAWIAWGEAAGFSAERHAQTSMVAHRDNGRLSVDSPEVAAAVFARVRPFVPAQLGRLRPCGCNPNIRLYRYGAGQRFGPHVDGSNRLPDGSSTHFTLLLYLNEDGLVGGETVFYATHRPRPDNVVLRVAPRRGRCLLHAHGERCLTHEGAAVTRGVKYLLRTDVAYR